MAVKTTIRTPMPIKQRAKQFMMFDALKGLSEAIAEQEKTDVPQRELLESRIEEINQQLQMLRIGDEVTISYYCFYGGQYRTITEVISKIDLFWKEIQIGGTVIGFSEIHEIRINQ